MTLNEPYNRTSFLNFIEAFLPNDFEEGIQPVAFSIGVITRITRLGKCERSLNQLEVFEVLHSSVSDARITLSREIFRFMKANAIEYALVALVPENSPDVYRFSLISMSPKLNNGKVEFENSNPKRFSFLLGVNQHIRTPEDYFVNRGQIKDLDDLKERFSIEVLTKDFYTELFEWYKSAIQNFKPYPNNDPNKEEHVIRLITRLMFVWFIKQKKLIPEKLFDVSYLQTILKDFNPDDTTSSVYYNAILQNLFFATLNCEIKDRQFSSDSSNAYRGHNDDYKLKTKYRDNNGASWFKVSHDDVIKLFESIPFLNGGLFECLTREKDTSEPDDGFSREKHLRSSISNNLFFDKECGIISILKKYNWTIEENSPADVEVALDPELLGKVFENLLGTYNPETRETARKDSGSFYTPRPIVQYMTDESLISYLVKTLETNPDTIRQLITSLDLSDDVKSNKKLCYEVVNALQNIKILDPACGSGAFPMGILNRIVEIVIKIDPSVDRYKLKLNLLENCIYGVDIQTIAIQISKLRCFISLICEQEANSNKDDNYGIHPLPNLETKFVAANTLVSLGKDITTELRYSDKKLEAFKKELQDIRVHKMMNVSSFKEKKALRAADKQLCDQVVLLVSTRMGKPNEDYINVRLERIKALEKEKQKYKNVKMTTIVQTYKNDFFDDMEKQEVLSFDENQQKRESIERQIKDLNSEIYKERNKVRSSKAEQEIKKLVGWNPYKPTASSEFFDAYWMFNILDGFDIVIGNPPYVQLQKFKGNPIQEVYKNQGFHTHEATGDLYCLFYEKGLELLKPGGILCYITSNKWMRAGYGESLRAYFIKHNPVLLIDLGAGVFSSATVDTNILLIEKKGYEKKTLSCTLRNRSEEMSDFVRQNAIEMKYTKDAWAILNPIEQSIKAKIEKYGTPLKDWDVCIYRGILTGCNEAFIISGEKRKELIEEDPKSDEIIRPILRGRDIKRYGYEFADLWLINIECGFTNKHRGNMSAEEFIKLTYPAIYKHFMQVAKAKTKGKGLLNRDDKGDYWWELRSCAYTNDFSKQKIVWSDIATEPTFALVDADIYFNNTCYMLCAAPEYILFILNSKLLDWYFRKIATDLGNGLRYFKQFVETLPIINIDKDKTIKSLYNASEYERNQCICNLYHLDDEEIKFIEEAVEN